MQTRTFEEEFEEEFEEAVNQTNNKKMSSKDVSMKFSNSHPYTSVIASDIQNHTIFSYTKSFQEYFGSSDEVTEGFLQRQKDLLGFNLYILKKKSIQNALEIGLKSGKTSFNRRYHFLGIYYL